MSYEPIHLPGEAFVDADSGTPKQLRDWRMLLNAPTADQQTWSAPRVIDFTKYAQNETVDGLKTLGSPTVAINSSNRLDVTAVYDSANKVYFPGFAFAEGVFRARLIRGGFMIRFANNTFAGRAIWSAGTNLEVGYINASGVPTSLGTPVPMAGVAGDLIWVELIIGPMANGTTVLARSWKDGDPRPTSAQVTGTFGSGVVGIEQNQGFVALSSISGAATFERLEARDGLGGDVPIAGQAAFIGRWFPRFDGGRVGLCTVRGGDKFRFYVRGTTSVSVRYMGTLGVVSGLVPVADIFVNGVRTGSVTFTAVPGTFTSLVLASGLVAAQTSAVEVRVRGVHEYNDKWLKGAGLLLETIDPGAGMVAPWPDLRPKALFVGDSITEGIGGRTLSGGSMPVNSAGDESWPVLACETLGLQAVVNGFGGTGLTVSGSGGMPSADLAAFSYMKDRPIDTVAENIKYLVINLGTNDLGASVSGATFQAALVTFLRKCLRLFPSLRCVYVLRPFGGAYATETSAAVTAVGDHRLFYIDTSAWGLTYTDGVHPNVAGHATAASKLVIAMGNLQPASLPL